MITGTMHRGDGVPVPDLEATYRRFGEHIYTLCMRLLADKKAAEDATVGVFVQFSKESIERFDERGAFIRLRELAVMASQRQLRKRSGLIRHKLRKLGVYLSALAFTINKKLFKG